MRLGLPTLGVGNKVNNSVVPTPDPPALSTLNSYQTSSTSWVNAVWGPATWVQGGARSQVVNINLPSTTAPVGGYPTIIWFHPNGQTHEPSDAALIAQKAYALSVGFAWVSFEFRHPVPQVAEGAPHTDTGLAIQWIRSYAPALNLDKTKMVAACQSRGTLCVWQALQADLANPNGLTYASRQSSLLPAIWNYQGQSTYDTEQIADLAINTADRAAFLSFWGNDPRWGSAISSVATAPSVPYLTMRHREAYPTIPMPWGDFDEHDPWFGMAMVDAYTAAGQASKLTAIDNIPDANAWDGMVAWFADKLSITLPSSNIVDTATAIGAAVYDFNTSGNGVFQDTARTTPVTTNGQLIAAVKDLAGSNHATQASSASQPAYGTSGTVTGAVFSSDALDTTMVSGTSGYIGVAFVAGPTGANRDVISNGGNNATTRGFAIRRVSAGNSRVTWADGTTQGGISGAVVADGEAVVVEAIMTPTSQELWVNGVLAGSSSLTLGIDSSNIFRIGTNPASNSAFNGLIRAAVIAPSTAPTTGQREIIGNWLATKIGTSYG